MKLLFNYLPFSMKDRDLVVRSNKKAKGNNNNTSPFINGKTKTTPTKLSSNVNHNGNHKSNGNSSLNKSRILSAGLSIGQKAKKIKDRSKEKSTTPPTKLKKKKLKTNKSIASPKSQKKGNSKSSPELRPRRRASQTHFFKYQLARNPLKAEEEDLKLALLASLQQCGNSDPNLDLNQHELKIQDDSSQQSNSTPKQNHNHQNQNNLNQNHQQKQLKVEEPSQPIVTRTQPIKYDEEYLKRYRPETEDFLTFICFRITAPNKFNQDRNIIESAATNISDVTKDTNHYNTSTAISNNLKIGIEHKLVSNNIDLQNHKRSSSPYKLTTASNSPNHLSPSNRRRPTRQSPRLASSSRKISEFDNLNHISTAYDNSINYEEDVKRASIALEDMAQEINGQDDVHNQIAQDSSDSNLKLSTSPFKNNKHLVKGLMTREFAGAFADEEIIFESISNHKL